MLRGLEGGELMSTFLVTVSPLCAPTGTSACPLSRASRSLLVLVALGLLEYSTHQPWIYCPHLEKNNCESSHSA